MENVKMMKKEEMIKEGKPRDNGMKQSDNIDEL